MTQWVRALAALLKDPTPSPLLKHPHICEEIHTDTYIKTGQPGLHSETCLKQKEGEKKKDITNSNHSKNTGGK